MNKILFIDTLATGTKNYKCGLYAIGGILCNQDQEGFEEIQRFEMRMQPYENAKISENSLWISGIDRSDLIHYQKEDVVLNTFNEMLLKEIDIKNPNDKIYLAGFNISAFDIPFIKDWFDRNDNKRFRDIFYVQAIDLLTLASVALMQQRTQMPDFQLNTTAKFLDVVPSSESLYNCLDNAETCLLEYINILRRFNISEVKKYIKTENIIKNY